MNRTGSNVCCQILGEKVEVLEQSGDANYNYLPFHLRWDFFNKLNKAKKSFWKRSIFKLFFTLVTEVLQIIFQKFTSGRSSSEIYLPSQLSFSLLLIFFIADLYNWGSVLCQKALYFRISKASENQIKPSKEHTLWIPLNTDSSQLFVQRLNTP